MDPGSNPGGTTIRIIWRKARETNPWMAAALIVQLDFPGVVDSRSDQSTLMAGMSAEIQNPGII